MKIEIEFFGPFTDCEDQQWLCSIKEMPGMLDVGATKEEAFNQLMISLKVKIGYDNKHLFTETEGRFL